MHHQTGETPPLSDVLAFYRVMKLLSLRTALSLALLLPATLAAQALYPATDGTDTVPDEAMQVHKVRWTPQRTARTDALPTAVANSTSRYFPAIIDQKGGSCAQASGIGYMFSYEINRVLDREAKASEDHIFAYLFTWNFLNSGEDQGGFVDEGLNIAQRYGVMTAADYGYASAAQFKWATGYDRYLNAQRYRARKIYEFPCTTPEDIEHIKHYLAQKDDGHAGGGVLTFSTQSRDWTINDHYDGPSVTGYKSLLTRLGRDGAHALTIAGYDDQVTYTDAEGQQHQGAFIVVNTWGTYMHDGGHYYLPYHFFTDRPASVTDNRLSTSMTAVDVYIHEPKVVYKVEMEYTSRNDISLTTGATDRKDQTGFPLERHTPVIFRNQGGDYPLLGAYNNQGTLEFALDYTDYLPTEDHLHAQYFLRVLCAERGSKSGEGKLKAFSVIDYRTPGAPREYVCRDIPDEPFEWGENIYRICTVPWMRVSANVNRWRTASGQISPSKTYVLRTAGGQYAKLRFVGYDPASGKLTVQYQTQHDGTRNFKED